MDEVQAQGISIHRSQGEHTTIWGLVGDVTRIDINRLLANDVVQDIKRVSEPYKLASRRFHPEDTHIKVGDVTIGSGFFAVIAGPCSIESEEQI